MKIGIFGNGENYSRQIVNDLLTLFVSPDDTLVIGNNGIDKYVHIYAKEKGNPVLIYYPNQKLQMPQRISYNNEKLLLDCDLILCFNTKQQENSTTIIKRCIDLGKEFFNVSLDRKGYTVESLNIKRRYRYDETGISTNETRKG